MENHHFEWKKSLYLWQFFNSHAKLPEGIPSIYMLVGGFNPFEKYYIVNWDYYSQCIEKWKMFQTTNQYGMPLDKQIWNTILFQVHQDV